VRLFPQIWRHVLPRYRSLDVALFSLSRLTLFTGTGDFNEIGRGRGKFYSLNVPLRDGIDDNQYRELFEPVMEAVIQKFIPNVIVLQCGADSLRGSPSFSILVDGSCRADILFS